MQPFTTHTGVAAPLLLDDINTDQITPMQGMRSLHPDYGEMLFARWRLRADGSENPDFVLNKPQYRSASILVAGNNFGCGSSREGAVWAMVARGIRCIVARSFADLYRDNCLKNGILPLVLAPADATRFDRTVESLNGSAPIAVDLTDQSVTCPNGTIFSFTMDEGERAALLAGLDEIDLTLRQDAGSIQHWESNTQRLRPWLQSAARR
jgi:3-isopropylmalate/(R)-2-methylmalate dehydratase small subunit